MASILLPVSDEPVGAWLKKLALAALVFQAIFAMAGFSGELKPEYGAALAMVLLLLAGKRALPELVRQPVVRSLLVLVVFVALHSAYASFVFPSIGYSKQLTAGAELIRLGVFSCVIGWWLSLLPRAIPLLSGLMVVGLLAAVFVYLPWSALPGIWDGQLRPRFGVPENLGGQLSALGGWVALCLLLALWSTRLAHPHRRLLMLACFLAYIGCFCALLFSQSRGAWLAFAATLPTAVLGFCFTRRHGPDVRVPWMPILSVAAISMLLLLGARDIVAMRLAGVEQLLPVQSDSQSAVTKTVSRETSASLGTLRPGTDPHKVDPASKAVSIRMALYELGMDRWRERPLLGWGLRTTPALIAAGHLDMGGQRHAHLHNAYLDALVGMGLIGAGLLCLVFLTMLRDLFLAWTFGAVSNATFWALCGCIGIVLIANGFDSLLWRFEYARAPLEVVFGCCIAYGIIRRRGMASTT